MPKKRGNGGVWGWNNDESRRHEGDFSKRRVSFKTTNRFERNKGNKWEQSIRSHFEAEDIDMGNIAGGSNVKERHRMKGPNNARGGRSHRAQSPVPGRSENFKSNLLRGRLPEVPSHWYKVTLPFGSKYGKEYVVKTLLHYISPETLIPLNWRASGKEVSFFVDEYKTASKLYQANKKITAPDGFKIIIHVMHAMPHIEINEVLKEKMKLAMAQRYNPATKALDLTKFHVDPMLQDIFCALFRPILMLTAIDIIAENIPELEALNLNNNKLNIVEHMKCLSTKLPALKILYLGNNRIRDIKSFDNWKGSKITELLLDGNPLCDKFKDQTIYVSEVRKRFPKVIKLDGVDLPPPIVFDVVEDIKLPNSNQTFLCNDAGGNVVRTFLEQYFLIYDSDNRQQLLQAYHENAMFSMSTSYSYGQSQKNSSPLSWYLLDNRNLMKVHDADRRFKLLRQGQLSVVSFISEMPKTQHDMNSFKVDLSFYTPQLLMLNVTGVFKELGGNSKSPPLRSFNRGWIIVAVGSGFCIANEQVFITNATSEESKEAFKLPPIIPSAPNSVSNTPINSPIASSSNLIPVPDEATKQQMVFTLSQQTGMNANFSFKCLSDINWDYQQALHIFNELHKQGSIPPEAFVPQ